MLRKFNYFDSKQVSTPYDSNMHRRKNFEELISQMKYSQIIRLSLLYIANNARPNIAYTVRRLIGHTYNHNKEHWNLEKLSKGVTTLCL